MKNERNLLITYVESIHNIDQLSLSELQSLTELMKKANSDERLNKVLNDLKNTSDSSQINIIIDNYLSIKSENSTTKEDINENQKKLIMMPSLNKNGINRKAGFMDFLVLALITGFAGGIITSIILFIII